MWYNSAMSEMITFDSGLRLIVTPNPAVRSASVGVFVKAGSVYERPEQGGISHLLEHMLFKGTKKRTAFDIANEIDSLGAQINAYTAKSSTCFHTLSRDVHAAECMEVLADMYFDATFLSDEFAKERKVVLEELAESEDTPDDLCLEKLSSAFFKGHALGRSILGTAATLKEMRPEDLTAYRDSHYVSGGTVISVAGNVTVDDARGMVTELFEKRFGERAAASPVGTVSAAEVKGGFSHRKKQIEQTHIAFAFPGLAYDSNRAMAMRMLAAVFGMEMSSRLFQSVREKRGLCYSIMGYPSFYENNGSFVIYTSVNPGRVEEAVAAIRHEIDLIVADGITEEELKKGREQLVTGMVLGQESTSAMMKAYGRHAMMTGELYDMDEKIAEIESVTRDDVLALAREVFVFDKMAASCVAPEIEDVKKMMKECTDEKHG